MTQGYAMTSPAPIRLRIPIVNTKTRPGRDSRPTGALGYGSLRSSRQLGHEVGDHETTVASRNIGARADLIGQLVVAPAAWIG